MQGHGVLVRDPEVGGRVVKRSGAIGDRVGIAGDAGDPVAVDGEVTGTAGVVHAVE